MEGIRMRILFPIVLLGLAGLALLLPEVEARPLAKGDLRKIQRAAEAYVRESDPKARDAIFKPVASAAKKLDFRAVPGIVRDAVWGRTARPGFTHDVKFEAAGETWTYSVHFPAGRHKGRLPLVVDPGHTSLKDAGAEGIEDVMGTWLDVSGARDEVIYIRTRVLDKLSLDGRYDAWTVPPRRAAGQPNLDSIAHLLLAAIGDACLRYPVDPDRVTVHGISQTGYWAWWLGAVAPDRFAAVVPVSSVTWHVRGTIANLKATNAFVLHGTADATCPFVQAQGAVDDLKALKAPVAFTAVQGGQHVAGVFPKWKELWPEVTKARRDPYPKAFERAFVSPIRPHAFWVRARDMETGEFNPWAPTARVEGRIEKQTIHIEAKGMRGLTVFLAPQMMDLDKKVTIRVNDKRVFVGKVKPGLRHVLDLARERGDGVGYAAAVEVDVP